MATKKKARRSGSQKINAKRKGAATGHLNRAVAAIDRSALINKILIRGTPIPDVISGSFTVKSPSDLGSALNSLFKIPGATFKPVQLFPRGIPVIDQIKVVVDGKIR